MSKQSEAKVAQGYNEKPLVRKCSNCKHFGSKKEEEAYMIYSWTKETAIRCTLGGFAVKKTAVCDKHEFGEPQ